MIIYHYYCNSKHWPRRIYKIKTICNKIIRQKDLNFKKNKNYYMNIILTNNKEIKRLNKKYKNKSKTTDVLTFVSNIKNNNYNRDIFCDIFFSAETIDRDAVKNNTKFYDHFTHLLVHCFLHVNGFNHKKIKNFEIMKEIEIKILKNLGISNPY